VSAWAPVVDRFFQLYGWPGLTVLVSGACVGAILWLVKHFSRVTLAVGARADVQTQILVKSVEGLSGQTEVLRTMKDELRGVGQAVRDSDERRHRDVERIVDTIYRSREEHR
jgi:hypothetical protein